MTWTTLVLGLLAVAVGSALQGSVGFGLGLLAAPLLTLLDPRLVPGPLLFDSLVLVIVLAHRERHAIRYRDLAWSIPGRLLGTAVAVAVLAVLPPERFTLALGVIILLAVWVSAAGFHLALRGRSLFGAGTLAGFFGTTVAVGGPPMALVYQREAGPSIRATLSAFFVVGTVISLVGLRSVGLFGRTELLLALALLPGVPVGYFVARRAAALLDRGYTRTAVLVVSAASGLAVILKALL